MYATGTAAQISGAGLGIGRRYTPLLRMTQAAAVTATLPLESVNWAEMIFRTTGTRPTAGTIGPAVMYSMRGNVVQPAQTFGAKPAAPTRAPVTGVLVKRTGPIVPTAAQLAAMGMRVMTAAESSQYSACTAEYRRLTGGTSRPTAAVQYMSYAGWLSRNRAACYSMYKAVRLGKLFSTRATMVARWQSTNPEAVAARKAKALAVAAAAAAKKKAHYLRLCNAIQMPPLADLGYDTLTVSRTTIGRDVDEPASEKREMRARLMVRYRAIKLHALGLGPVPSGGMPTSGPTLYWVPELAFKREVCGSLTPAETARAVELGNAARAFLHKRARDKRKSRLKKLVAIAAVVVGAVYLGPMIAGALKGGGVAGAAGSKAAAAKAIAVKSATAAKAIAVKTAAAKATAIAAGKAALAAKAVGGAKMLASAAATSSAKTAAVKTIAATTAEKIASKAARAAALAEAAATPAGIAANVASLAEKAKALVPKVVDVANNVRTLKAIADGEIPPPPITLEGDSFASYATSLAQQYLQKELRDKQEKLTEAQLAADNREIQIEIDRLQRETVERLRRQQIQPQQISYPLPAVAPAVAAGERAAPDDMMKYALLAVPLMAAVFMR